MLELDNMLLMLEIIDQSIDRYKLTELSASNGMENLLSTLTNTPINLGFDYMARNKADRLSTVKVYTRSWGGKGQVIVS